MTGNDINSVRFVPRLTDLSLAVGLLTRIPLPSFMFPSSTERAASHAAWAYPLVGLVVGSAVAAAAAFTLAVGMPAGLAAMFALLVHFLVTGAMHEDGLADCADGFWGGWTSERRLEIMKDSQIGTYGVLALIWSIGTKWILLSHLLLLDGWPWLLIASALTSRAAMVAVMYGLPNARKSGLSQQTGRPPALSAVLALGVALTGLSICVPEQTLSIMLLLAAVTAAVAYISWRKIRGQTGDVLGATQQMGEIIVLAVMAAQGFGGNIL